MNKNLIVALALTFASTAAMAEEFNLLSLDDVSEDLRRSGEWMVENCEQQAIWKLSSRSQYSPEYGEQLFSAATAKLLRTANDSQGNPEYVIFIDSVRKSHVITLIGSIAPISFICTGVIESNAKNIEKNIRIAEKNEKRIAKGKKPKKLKSVWVADHAELLETTINGRTVH